MNRVGCFYLIFAAFLGSISVNYILKMLFHKDIPFWADMLIGIIVGGVTIWIAFIIWLLTLCGVDVALVK